MDRFATLYAARPVRGGNLSRGAIAVPILMYHSVSDTFDATIRASRRLTTSCGRFREHMRYLRETGFDVISLPELTSRFAVGGSTSGRIAVLTFDDGLDDFRVNAWPTIAEFGYAATVFLATGHVGASRTPFGGRKALSWAAIRELHQTGVSFGAHTVTHPVLHGMSWGDIRHELRDSRARIEDELNAPVHTFAYPYAFPQEDRRFALRLSEELGAAGYSMGVTTVIGRARPTDDPLLLKRLPVGEGDHRMFFAGKLDGRYDWVGRPQLIVRHAKRFWSWISRS